MQSDDKVNILVVDDLSEKLLVMETILEELGQNVVTVRSGEEALKQVLAREFAVILLDVNMPGMDGLETAALIRRRKKSAHTPIIFVTAFADEIHATRGYSLGAVDYILSPVVPEVLRTKVRVFVELQRMTQQVKRQAEERVVLAQEHAARTVAEEATRRFTFLAEASKILANSLDYDVTLRGLLRVTLPYLGDLSAITLAGEADQLGETTVAWFHADQGPCGLKSAALLPAAWADLVRRALAAQQSEHLADICLPAPRPLAVSGPPHNGAAGEACPDFELHSVVAIPLVARQRALGVLSLAMGPSGRRYQAADLALADELAARAASALDNARLYRDIQEADRGKNEFLSMLAHELRNPLAPIRNAVQILRGQGAQDPAVGPLHDMIDRQVQQLVRLVDDLLDVSRITRGKIRLHTEPVEVAAIVERAVETSRPVIDSRKHTLAVSIPPEPLCVEGDPVRLAQVLGNLLNNAAKYTEEGGRIWLNVECEGADVVLRVRDTGIGIPSDMLSSVFNLFTQVERSLDRSQGGLGIGLTLVRQLVEMHGGRVQATSAGPNQGSEFIVRLPVSADNGKVGPSGNGQAACAPSGSGLRVLVVDDNRDGAASLAMVLRLAQHDVRVAYDGPNALDTAKHFQPEVVLLDIGLPGMDGYEVARRLRLMPGLEKTLLVALTGYGQAEDLRRSEEAGFDHHLVKPADIEVLNGLFASLAV